METRFLLVRHPETEANVDGRLVGRGDTPYTVRGRQQRELLAERVASWGPDVILSSPLRRAREVAEDAQTRCQARLVLDDRLTELDFGVAEGLTYAQIGERGIAFDFRSLDAPVCESGESRRAIYLRSAAAASDHASDAARIAIVSHGGVFRSLLAHLVGLPIDFIWSFDIRPAAVCEIHVFDGFGMVHSFESSVREKR